MKKLFFILMLACIFFSFATTEISKPKEGVILKNLKIELPNKTKVKNHKVCEETSNWLFDGRNKIISTDICSNFIIIAECTHSFYREEGQVIVTAGYGPSADRANIYIDDKEFEFSYTGGPAGRLFIGEGTRSIDFIKHLINTSNSQSDSININVELYDESKYIGGEYVFDANNLSGLYSFQTLGFKEVLKKFWDNTKCEAIE